MNTETTSRIEQAHELLRDQLHTSHDPTGTYSDVQALRGLLAAAAQVCSRLDRSVLAATGSDDGQFDLRVGEAIGWLDEARESAEESVRSLGEAVNALSLLRFAA